MRAIDEANALLKAICDAPDEDTPRLVYADWLQEHDEPSPDPAGRAGNSPGAGSGPTRAEFIRIQIELARIEGDDPRRPAAARRERELLTAHESDWSKPLPPRVSDAVFRRGFVTGVNLSPPGTFTRHAADVFATHPVTAIWLNGDERQLRAAARSPYLSRVRDLGVFGAHEGSLGAVLASQFATNLHGLHLQGINQFARRSRLGDFLPLLDRPHTGGLRRLGLEFSGVDVGEVRRFTRTSVLANLAELTLSSDAIGDTTARELAATPAAAGLRILRLRADRLTDAGVRHLADSPNLSGLRRLMLFGARQVTAAGFAALAASPHLRNLTDLDLRYTAVTPDDVRALADSPNLPRLSRLVLNCTPAGPDAQFNYGAWNACLPDHGPGVVWADEMRE